MLKALLFISRLFDDVFGVKQLPTTVLRKPSAGTNSFTKITLLFGMMEPKCWVEIYTISLQTPKSIKLIKSRWRYELVFFHLSHSFLCPIHSDTFSVGLFSSFPFLSVPFIFSKSFFHFSLSFLYPIQFHFRSFICMVYLITVEALVSGHPS